MSNTIFRIFGWNNFFSKFLKKNSEDFLSICKKKRKILFPKKFSEQKKNQRNFFSKMNSSEKIPKKNESSEKKFSWDHKVVEIKKELLEMWKKLEKNFNSF